MIIYSENLKKDDCLTIQALSMLTVNTQMYTPLHNIYDKNLQTSLGILFHGPTTSLESLLLLLLLKKLTKHFQFLDSKL